MAIRRNGGAKFQIGNFQEFGNSTMQARKYATARQFDKLQQCNTATSLACMVHMLTDSMGH